jgi:hypothetical protein
MLAARPGAARSRAPTIAMPRTRATSRNRHLQARTPERSRAWSSSPPMRQRPYDRRTELPRVLPLWPHEVADESPQGRALVVAKLARALRAERRRGIAGHWTYDLARHAALLRVYRLELAASRACVLQRAADGDSST